MKHNLKKKQELAVFKKAYDKGMLSIDDIMKEAKEYNTLMTDSLAMMPNWTGTLWRGTAAWTPWAYRQGSTLTFNNFTSATKDKSVAKDFADNYNIAPKKYLLRLNVKTGKDIENFARTNDEEEVMLQPGTKFRVTSRETPYKVKKTDDESGFGEKGDHEYYIITLDEVSSSAKKFDVGKHEPRRRMSMSTESESGRRQSVSITAPSGNDHDHEDTVLAPTSTEIEDEDPYAIKDQQELEELEKAKVKLRLFDGSDDPPTGSDEPEQVLDTDGWMKPVPSGYRVEQNGVLYEMIDYDTMMYWVDADELQTFMQALEGNVVKLCVESGCSACAYRSDSMIAWSSPSDHN